jgi:hypothetical protein
MFIFKVSVWFQDTPCGAISEFYVKANNCIDAENEILDTMTGTMRDSILSYYSEIIDVRDTLTAKDNGYCLLCGERLAKIDPRKGKNPLPAHRC